VSAAISNTEAKLLVVKCFDLLFCPTGELCNFFQTTIEYCKSQSLVETQVYLWLSEFQGQLLPKFYSQYYYFPSFSYVTSILLEYILNPTLDKYLLHLHPPVSPCNWLHQLELFQIFDIGIAALNDIHSQCIYYYDIQLSNVHWNSDTMALRIVDWKFSLFDQPNAEHFVLTDWFR